MPQLYTLCSSCSIYCDLWRVILLYLISHLHSFFHLKNQKMDGNATNQLNQPNMKNETVRLRLTGTFCS
jgi:hypothetical protein